MLWFFLPLLSVFFSLLPVAFCPLPLVFFFPKAKQIGLKINSVEDGNGKDNGDGYGDEDGDGDRERGEGRGKREEGRKPGRKENMNRLCQTLATRRNVQQTALKVIIRSQHLRT